MSPAAAGSPLAGPPSASQPSRVARSELTVEQLRTEMLEALKQLPPIQLRLADAYGCVLAADVVASGDLPAFSSAAVNGFAVRSTDTSGASAAGPATLALAGEVSVGQRPEATVGGGEAVGVTPGAPIPAGADCVVPLEHCLVEGDVVHVLTPVREGEFINRAGREARAGEVLVAKGRRLTAPELGLLASGGQRSVLVHPRPRVVILSVGDGLVEPGRSGPFGSAPDASSFVLYACVRDAGAVSYLGGIVPPEAEALKDAVLTLAARADCFVVAGQAAVGEGDVANKAFFRRGHVGFPLVALHPGGRQGFGFVDGTPFFGVPGDAVSSFVSFEMLVRPALLKMMGRAEVVRPQVEAVLEVSLSGPAHALTVVPVRVVWERGWRARSLVPGEAGGPLRGLAGANGLALLPPGKEDREAGSPVSVMLFRPLEG